MFGNFECDKCGACCETLIVEAHWADLLREPRLMEAIGPKATRQSIRDAEHCIVLYDKHTRACPFLDGNTKHCTIYPTRPEDCVLVEPGDAKCQQARRMKGLPLLADKDGQPPSRDLLEASCWEYDLDVDELL